MTKLDQTSILSMGMSCSMSLIGGCWLAAASSALPSDWWMEVCQRSVLFEYWHNVILTSSWHRSDITNVTSSHSQAITPHNYQIQQLWERDISDSFPSHRQNKDYCSKVESKYFLNCYTLTPVAIMMLGQWVTHSYFTHYLLTPAQTRQIFINIITADKSSAHSSSGLSHKGQSQFLASDVKWWLLGPVMRRQLGQLVAAR